MELSLGLMMEGVSLAKSITDPFWRIVPMPGKRSRTHLRSRPTSASGIGYWLKLSNTYTPLIVYSPKRLKGQFRGAFKLRKNIKRSIGMFKKEKAIGLAAEKMLDDRRKLIALQALAKGELTAC